MLKFLIFALQLGFTGRRGDSGRKGGYQGGNTDSEKRAFERARKRRIRSWWPKAKMT